MRHTPYGAPAPLPYMPLGPSAPSPPVYVSAPTPMYAPAHEPVFMSPLPVRALPSPPPPSRPSYSPPKASKPAPPFDEPPGYDISLRNAACAVALYATDAHSRDISKPVLAEDQKPVVLRTASAIPTHKGACWQPSRRRRNTATQYDHTSGHAVAKDMREWTHPLEVDYEAKTWDAQGVAQWLRTRNCSATILEEVLANGVDGRVMDEIVTMRDHIALQELGMEDGDFRLTIIRRWLDMKPGWLKCRPSIATSTTEPKEKEAVTSTARYSRTITKKTSRVCRSVTKGTDATEVNSTDDKYLTMTEDF